MYVSVGSVRLSVANIYNTPELKKGFLGTDLLSAYCAYHKSRCLVCWWHSELYKRLENTTITFLIGSESCLAGWPWIDVQSMREGRHIHTFSQSFLWCGRVVNFHYRQEQCIQYCGCWHGKGYHIGDRGESPTVVATRWADGLIVIWLILHATEGSCT